MLVPSVNVPGCSFGLRCGKKKLKNKTPGDSSGDLFIPDRWVSHEQPLEFGSRELTIPKRPRIESAGADFSTIGKTPKLHPNKP